MSARTPPSSIRRWAARNSSRTNVIRSPIRVTLGHSTTWAPLRVRLVSSALPFAPPAWVTTIRTSAGGLVTTAASSSATSLPASCAPVITTTGVASNSDGEVSEARSPGLRLPAATSRTPAPVSATAAATNRATARSTSSSSSPTTTPTGPLAVAVAARGEAMPEACQTLIQLGLLRQDGLAAAPDLQRPQAVRPGERALVVGVPGNDVGVPAADHAAQLGRAQRL